MPIPETYINNVGSLSKFLETIRTAGVPDRVTIEFLKTLGFQSSNDRPIISVLKAINFLDQNGAPTNAYKAFRDPNQGPRVMAQALKTSYPDLYLANTKAHDLPIDKLKGIIATKTTKGDAVVKLIASTFKALAKAADFSEGPAEEETPATERANGHDNGHAIDLPIPKRTSAQEGPAFHYNIQIHLPTTTDLTVYNAIFKSLRENLF